MIKKYDIIIIVLLLLFSVCLFIPGFSSSKGLTAQIYLDGELEETVVLSDVSQPYILTVGECKIELDKDGVCFAESSCKDKLCIKHGKMTKSSDSMACVPNKVLVVLKSSKNQTDAVAY